MKKIVDLRKLRDFCKAKFNIGDSTVYDVFLQECVDAIFYWLKQQPDAEEYTGEWGISAEEEKPTKVEKKPSYKQLFYDAFPKARKHRKTGTPCFEACHVWPKANFECSDDCDRCWNKESR